MDEFYTPRQVVEELDRYIIGQSEAKRAVAIALRNRHRRSRLPENIRDEFTPKNILMVGPTGVGKTEIARRLAKLVRAPFVKVEATKFTEVGYVGRDVESMIRDLVEDSVRLVKKEKMEAVKGSAARHANDRLIDLLSPRARRGQAQVNPFEALFRPNQPQPEREESQEERAARASNRAEIAARLAAGEMEHQIVEIELEEAPPALDMFAGTGIETNMGDVLGSILPKKKKLRKVTVSEARRLLEMEEAQKLIDNEDVNSEAIRRAEQEGILFIDEMDKIAGKGGGSGPDVSREGVQRDILPIVEGSTVVTKYGPVKTDFMLFIAAGAFHISKVTDLIPELQGRFPITVTLKSLTQEDFRSILSQPDNALTKQYAELLRTDHVNLTFTDDALSAIAQYAWSANESGENIGARRLHTIMENMLEDISFNAGGNHPMVDIVVDAKYVSDHLGEMPGKKDLRKFIL